MVKLQGIDKRDKCHDVVLDTSVSRIGLPGINVFSATAKWKSGRKMELQLPSAHACPSSFVLRSLVQISQSKKWQMPHVARENAVTKFV